MGESLFWGSAKLFSEAGSHILFVFLLLAGVLLLTGASIAGVVQATREAATTTSQRVRRTTRPAATIADGSAARRPDPGESVEPPEPEDQEPVVRATHVEAPALDGSERYPDMYDEDEPAEPEPEEEPGTRRSRRPSRFRRTSRAEVEPEQERAHADGQPALGRHRGRRHRLPAAQAVAS